MSLPPSFLSGHGLGGGDEFAQMMGIAEGVQAPEQCIGAPVIMPQHAEAADQQAKCRQRVGKVAAMPTPSQTGTGKGVVFRDLDTDDQLDNLAPLSCQLHQDPGLVPAALAGASERDDDVVIQVVDEDARGPLVVLLPARLAATDLALRSRRRLAKRGG